MSDKLSVTGGVWVACGERLPNKSHGDEFGIVSVKAAEYKIGQFEIGRLIWSSVSADCMYGYSHWLDTTVPIMTVAEHEAEVAELRERINALEREVGE